MGVATQQIESSRFSIETVPERMAILLEHEGELLRPGTPGESTTRPGSPLSIEAVSDMHKRAGAVYRQNSDQFPSVFARISDFCLRSPADDLMHESVAVSHIRTKILYSRRPSLLLRMPLSSVSLVLQFSTSRVGCGVDHIAQIYPNPPLKQAW